MRHTVFLLKLLIGGAALLAQPATYQIIDLGPQTINITGYQSFALQVTAGPGSLNNNHQAVVRMFNSGGIKPDPVGFSGPFTGGTTAVGFWEGGFLRDMRWHTPAFPILNPQFAFLGTNPEPSISSNGNIAVQCGQSNFADVSATYPYIEPNERCLGNWAARYNAATKRWQRIGALAADPFTVGTTSSATGINQAGVAVGNSTRPDQTYNDSCAAVDQSNRNRAFRFDSAFTRLTPNPNLPTNDFQNQCVGSSSESIATAINDSGLTVGYVLNNFGTGLPYCDPQVFPNLANLKFVPQIYGGSTGANPLDGLPGAPNKCTIEAQITAVASNNSYAGNFRRLADPVNLFRPFAVVGGQFVEIPIPTGIGGSALGINAFGDVVGSYRQNDVDIPFLYRRASGQVVDLRTRIPANPPGLNFTSIEPIRAVAINDLGSMLVVAKIPLSSSSFLVRTLMLRETSPCSAAVELLNTPATVPQAGIPTELSFRVRQTSSACQILPLGRFRAFRNGQPDSLFIDLTGYSDVENHDTTAWRTYSLQASFLPGNNQLEIRYEGNGLYSSAVSPAATVNSGPTCIDSALNYPLRKLGFTVVSPTQMQQTVQITNNTGATLTGFVALAVSNLPAGVTLQGNGTIQNCASGQLPAGSPFLAVSLDGLAPGQRRNVLLRFNVPSPQPIQYGASLLSINGKL